MTTYQIIYSATDDTMGDTSPEDCGLFREWAEDELKREYPDHDITVSAEPSTLEVWTDDDERRDEIEQFASSLWDRCPWGWV